METERIALSQRERDRLKILHEVQQKLLTQVAAAQRLKISDRQLRPMLFRLRQRGDSSLARVELFQLGRIIRVDLSRFAVHAEFRRELSILVGHADGKENWL